MDSKQLLINKINHRNQETEAKNARIEHHNKRVLRLLPDLYNWIENDLKDIPQVKVSREELLNDELEEHPRLRIFLFDKTVSLQVLSNEEKLVIELRSPIERPETFELDESNRWTLQAKGQITVYLNPELIFKKLIKIVEMPSVDTAKNAWA